MAQLLLKANADPLIKAHTGVLVGKTAVTLARLHGTQSLPASHRSRSLVQMLLLHCGAACYTVHLGRVRLRLRVSYAALRSCLLHGAPDARTRTQTLTLTLPPTPYSQP